MTQPIDRRGFLDAASRRVGAGLLVLGLPGLRRDRQEEVGSTAPLRTALNVMREQRLYGVALAVPEDQEERHRLGRYLEALVDPEAPAGLRHLLVEAVYVCVPRGSLVAAPDDPIAIGLKGDENAALLRPFPYCGLGTEIQRRWVTGASLDLASPQRLEEGLRSLLHEGGRRKERVDAATTPAMHAHIDALGGEEWRDAWHRLHAAGRCAAPALVQAAERQQPETGSHHASSILGQFWRRLLGAADPHLPHGVRWKTRRAAPDPPCPACGMMRPRLPSRRFLRFLTK